MTTILRVLNVLALIALVLIGADWWVQMRARQVTIAIVSPLVQPRPTPPIPSPVVPPTPAPTPPVPHLGRK